jgi:hypothetical protein
MRTLFGYCIVLTELIFPREQVDHCSFLLMFQRNFRAKYQVPYYHSTMKGLVWWLVFFFSGSFLVDHAKGAAADADSTATIQKGLIHNLLRGEVPSHDIVKEDVATSTRARVTEHHEGEMASAIDSADRHQKKHLLQQVDEEGEYYNPTEWCK